MARRRISPPVPDRQSPAGRVLDPHSPGPLPGTNSSAPAANTTPDFRHWGRVYAFVLAFLALLIALFAWLTRIYS